MSATRTASERCADALRVDNARLDDIRRARLERDLIAAWRQRATARFADRRGERRGRRWAWSAAVAVSGLLGGLVVLYGAQSHDALVGSSSAANQSVPAFFEVRVGDAATQTGTLVEGQTLASGSHGEVRVQIGATQIQMARASRLRFDRLTNRELRVELTAGEIHVAYHPVRRGEQQLSVETISARVLVVGTEFSVAVDAAGGTAVRVSEGVVRVMSRVGDDDHVLAAGDQTRVEVQSVDIRARVIPPDRDPSVDPSGAFAADLDFGESPEAVDIQRLLTPRAEAVPARAYESGHPLIGHRDPEPSDEVVEPAERMTPERRLDLSRALLRQGRHDQARALLRVLIDSGDVPAYQVEAWTLTAESYTAQGYVPRAADSYRRAADVGRGTQQGHNAVFAWARLLERYTRDQQAAVLVYERYLREAPEGALSLQAADALCRLGVVTHCR
jgi:hypothetical protein